MKNGSVFLKDRAGSTFSCSKTNRCGTFIAARKEGLREQTGNKLVYLI
ncbi:MAG: hypothetical protein HC906_14550 [Bacteroidales bacterium]|nr:hypothetical protein [Bacteroidales bacterium]